MRLGWHSRMYTPRTIQLSLATVDVEFPIAAALRYDFGQPIVYFVDMLAHYWPIFLESGCNQFVQLGFGEGSVRMRVFDRCYGKMQFFVGRIRTLDDVIDRDFDLAQEPTANRFLEFGL